MYFGRSKEKNGKNMKCPSNVIGLRSNWNRAINGEKSVKVPLFIRSMVFFMRISGSIMEKMSFLVGNIALSTDICKSLKIP